ncbi:hypothetical protein MTO96_009757 [Rhipicephalus appendiculatus]
MRSRATLMPLIKVVDEPAALLIEHTSSCRQSRPTCRLRDTVASAFPKNNISVRETCVPQGMRQVPPFLLRWARGFVLRAWARLSADVSQAYRARPADRVPGELLARTSHRRRRKLERN